MSALSLASKITAGAFFFAALVTTWARLALTYDGSFYLIWLAESRTMVVPHNRLAVALLTLPAQIVIRLSENVELTSFVFSVVYAFIPFVSIVACWLIVRKKQIELMIWPLISIGLLSIANQPNQISENLIVCQLAWPLLLNALVSNSKKSSIVSFCFAIFLVALHPVSIIFLTLIGAAAWFVNRKAEEKYFPTLALALLGLAASRLVILLTHTNKYEQGALQIDTLNQMFKSGFSGDLILAVTASLALAFILAKANTKNAFVLTCCCALTLVSGGFMIAWSANLPQWYQALPYGRFLFIPFSIIMIAAVCDKLGERSAQIKLRAILATVISLFFLVAALVQSNRWTYCTDRLSLALANSPTALVTTTEEQWLAATPLNHWSCVPLAIILQGRHPKTLLISPELAEQWHKDGIFRLVPWENKFTEIFFKLPKITKQPQ